MPYKDDRFIVDKDVEDEKQTNEGDINFSQEENLMDEKICLDKSIADDEMSASKTLQDANSENISDSNRDIRPKLHTKVLGGKLRIC